MFVDIFVARYKLPSNTIPKGNVYIKRYFDIINLLSHFYHAITFIRTVHVHVRLRC
jgi:hypothetical protein